MARQDHEGVSTAFLVHSTVGVIHTNPKIGVIRLLFVSKITKFRDISLNLQIAYYGPKIHWIQAAKQFFQGRV